MNANILYKILAPRHLYVMLVFGILYAIVIYNIYVRYAGVNIFLIYNSNFLNLNQIELLFILISD